jgi:hypothetical protein
MSAHLIANVNISVLFKHISSYGTKLQYTPYPIWGKMDIGKPPLSCPIWGIAGECGRLSFCLQIYKTGMITMLSGSLIQQHNVNTLACLINMTVVPEDSSCAMVGWGARAACAEVSAGSAEDAKAKHGQKVYMDFGT